MGGIVMLKKIKTIVVIMMFSFVLVGIAVLGSSQKASAAETDIQDNLAKSSVGIVGGWSETLIYPTQEAAKPGAIGKVLLPFNIVVGAVKGAVREVGGAIDFLTFYKGKNIVDSYPGEEL